MAEAEYQRFNCFESIARMQRKAYPDRQDLHLHMGKSRAREAAGREQSRTRFAYLHYSFNFWLKLFRLEINTRRNFTTQMASIRPNAQSRARIVPWRSSTDLLWVKEAFYPGPDAPDQRYDALTMVQPITSSKAFHHLLTNSCPRSKPGQCVGNSPTQLRPQRC